MVYDVPRNFIGDTHWREPQAIQDGDELELEKGVLIQVGEQVEKTATDLTELLEKRNPKPTVADHEAGDQSRSVVGHTTTKKLRANIPSAIDLPQPASVSQLRPKSLNALLGTPRGPVGRAALPTKSPAEHKREQGNVYLGRERSPKRPRLQYPTGTIAPLSSSIMARCDALPKPTERATTSHQAAARLASRNNSSAITEATTPPRSVVPEPMEDIEHVNSRQRPKKKSRNNQETFEVHSAGALASDASRPEGTNRKEANSRQKTQDTQRNEPKTTPARPLNYKNPPSLSENRASVPTHATQDPISSHGRLSGSTERENALNENKPRPENLLRIASSKPRRKLMYRDLLPHKAPPRETIPAPNLEQSHDISSGYHRQDCNDNRLQKPVDQLHQARHDRSQSILSTFSESTEDNFEQAEVLLREDEGEYLYPPDKDLPLDLERNSTIVETLFLTQPMPEEPLLAISPHYSRQPADLSEAVDATEQPHISPEPATQQDLNLLSTIASTLPPDADHCMTVTESLLLSQPPLNDAVPKHITPQPNEEDPPAAPPQATNTLAEKDSCPYQHSPNHTSPHAHQPKPEIIKAALPPQHPSRPIRHPISNLTTRSSRPFTRCVSDPSARSTSTITITASTKSPPTLPKALSNDFRPPRISKPPPLPPPPPQIHIHSTNLYNYSGGDEFVEDSRPYSAKEQAVEPWSREAWDLFGFEGGDKSVGTSQGVERGGGDGGGMMGRGEDGWLVASQGFV